MVGRGNLTRRCSNSRVQIGPERPSGPKGVIRFDNDALVRAQRATHRIVNMLPNDTTLAMSNSGKVDSDNITSLYRRQLFSEKKEGQKRAHRPIGPTLLVDREWNVRNVVKRVFNIEIL